MSDVVWHDLECGRYTQDLDLWQTLAAALVRDGDSVLDVGAGTGRVSLALARRGHRVVSMDMDGELLVELGRRAAGEQLSVETFRADARQFSLPDRRFPLIIVPMQTIQLLGGDDGRRAFLSRARAHLQPGGRLAASIAVEEDFEEFQWRDGDPSPLPDIAESGGMSYFSQPTAVRRVGQRFVLERRREQVDATGARAVTEDSVALDIIAAADLHAEGAEAGLTALDVLTIAPTEEHIGSQVVTFGV